MITFTKEQLIASAHARIEFAEMMLAGELEPLKERTWSIELELARIALASLEADPVLYAAEETLAYAKHGELHLTCLSEPMGDAVIPLYTATPAPEVPDLKPDWMINEFHAGWNAAIARFKEMNKCL